MSPEEALKALAEHDRHLEARTPAREIFAQHRKARRWPMWAGLAAAAGLLFYVWPAPQVEAPRPVVVSEAMVPPEPEVAPVVVVAKPKPVRRPARPPQEPREVVTEFFPLMDAPAPFERGQLLRVVVPASTMRSVGLPVNPERWSERVQADVLVGEEGLARAIRFVSYEE